MSISGNPPYAWAYGTSLGGEFFWSQMFCEVMQAIGNRADFAGAVIDIWEAFDGDGNPIADEWTPDDTWLGDVGAWRHVNHVLRIRQNLEYVLVKYNDTEGDPFTLSTLMQQAVGQSTYKRTSSQLTALGYFDPADVEELLKCIDCLVEIRTDADATLDGTAPYTNFGNSSTIWVGNVQVTCIKFEAIVDFPTLKIYKRFASSNTGVRVYPITEAWNELEVTYATMPSYDAGTLLGSVLGPISGIGWVSIPLSQSVGAHGVILLPYGEGTTATYESFQSTDPAKVPVLE